MVFFLHAQQIGKIIVVYLSALLKGWMREYLKAHLQKRIGCIPAMRFLRRKRRDLHLTVILL
jgi:hypothetical protein